MSTTDFVLTADADFDDLPRTLRREREVREREKRDREKREREDELRETATRRAEDPDKDERQLPRAFRADSSLHVSREEDITDSVPDYPAATVKHLDIPFLHLMAFFLKAVVAAVPALMLLGAILWGMGQTLKTLFPWLLKMQIFIQFPN